MKNVQNIGLSSNGLTSTEDTNNSNSSNEIIKREQIDGSPFAAIKQDGKWFLTWGEYVLSEKFETLQELKESLEREKWNTIGTFVIAIINSYERRKMQEEKILNDMYAAGGEFETVEE